MLATGQHQQTRNHLQAPVGPLQAPAQAPTVATNSTPSPTQPASNLKLWWRTYLEPSGWLKRSEGCLKKRSCRSSPNLSAYPRHLKAACRSWSVSDEKPTCGITQYILTAPRLTFGEDKWVTPPWRRSSSHNLHLPFLRLDLRILFFAA